MRALMKTGYGEGNVSLCDIPMPLIKPDQVLISVQVAGICGTDVHIYYNRFAYSPPIVLGHEFSGIVTSVGQNVKTIKQGDRVVSRNNPFACGCCRICRLGLENLCPEKKAMGIHSHGCFAPYIALPAKLLHVIPDNVSLEEAALMEPLAVAVHAVNNKCSIEKGDMVVVFGAGAIGLLAGQVALAQGADKVIIAGTSKDEKFRLKVAEKLGFKTLNVETEDIYESVMSVTSGFGVDVAIEASGSPLAIMDAIKILRRAGRMAILGITGQAQIPIAWDNLVSKGLSLFFAYSSITSDWQLGLKLLSEKKIDTLSLITDRYGIDQWQEAFKALSQFETIKPIFQIGVKYEKRPSAVREIKDIS